MENATEAEPRFEELIDLPDAGLRFNAQRVGPMNFNELRNADYGKGFRIPTMPELVPLIYVSLENKKKYKAAKNVVRTLRNHGITGNTGVLYVPEGIFVQDNPKLKDGKISMNQKTLEKKLGSYEEKGVVFSNNKTIRFTPYNYKREEQTPLELSRNTGIIALTGSEENAEKLAKASNIASEVYFWPWDFWILEDIDSSIISVADLRWTKLLNRFNVNADNSEYGKGKYSFGVLEK